MNLCGHGTVASIYGLMKHNKVASSKNFKIESPAGILNVGYDIEHQEIRMNQAPAELIEFNGDLEQLADSINLQAEDIDLNYPIVYGSTGIWTF